jgi:putative ABC transport system permease protein
MISNYLKIAFRNLWKHRSFSAINIGGLAIGIASCLLILQYVSFKLSFDQFHENAKDIYRVGNDRYQNGKLIQHGTITYSGVGRALKDDYEEVIENARMRPGGEVIIDHNNKKLEEREIFYVDPSFLTMFSFPMLAGNSATSLKEPYRVILSETLARKIFTEHKNDISKVIGEALVFNRDSMPYRVDGICKDAPANSHLRFGMLVSYSTVTVNWKEADHDFTQSDFWHYVQLKPGTDYKALNAKMDAFSKKHFDGNKVSGSDEKFALQPLGKAHLYSDFEYEIGNTGSATVVWSLLIIAIVIIALAWINYINLSTARSVERAKEVGIRKVAGSMKGQLIWQFMVESLLVNLIAVLLALILVIVLQSAFNQLLSLKLSLSYMFTKGMSGYSIPVGLILVAATGIFISGFYPAFVLSGFRPIIVLKGKLSTSKKGSYLRKGLVIGQFSITIMLLIGSLIVVQQMQFMNKKSLGFDMNQMLLIRSPKLTEFDSTFIDKVNNFKEELKQFSFVKGATTSWNVPGGETGRSFNVRRLDSASTTRYTMRHTGVDYDFINTYDIKLIAGRNFTRSDHNTDFSQLKSIMLNQSAVKLLGFKSPEEAIGKSIMRGDRKWEVVGVVSDFHQKSVRYPIEPSLFFAAYSSYSDISVKLNTTDVSDAIAAVRLKYDQFFPGNFFDYEFVDERYNSQYQNEVLFKKAFAIFAGIAIFVACLGLLGLTMYAAYQRTKEIGVRKVLGASTSTILFLLSKDFLKLVLVASIIAIPVAAWVMNTWLQGFAYRVPMSWWIFAVAGGAAFVIALATISFQSIRAATANPAKSLRTE